MLASIINSIKQSHSNPGRSSPSSTFYVENEPEPEEDGFLMVGQTSSERTTIVASSFVTNSIDAPPRYSEVTLSRNDALPSYDEYLSSSLTSRGASGYTGVQHVSSAPALTHYDHNQHLAIPGSAIDDVPLQLGPHIDAILCSQALNSDIAVLLGRTMLDLSQYEYNFEFEINLLRDHNMYDH